MRIMRLSDSAQPPVLLEEPVPQPQPQRGELLVRVYAVGVTPTELLWYPTTHSKNGEKRSRAVPGHEFSGVIAAAGEDTVGGDTLQRSWAVLKLGGRMITIAADSEYTTDDRVKQAFFIVEPNQQQLTQISRLLERGELQTVVDAVLPLARASEAYTGKVQQRRGRGKLVVAVAAQEGA